MLIAIVLGALVGAQFQHFATSDWIKALGDGFIKLIKMVIAPIIFCTVVSGISHIQDAKKVGRIGIKALVYFEVVSTFALMIGLAGRKPGAARRGLRRHHGERRRPWPLMPSRRKSQKSVDFFLHIIPDTVVGAFATGEILQVLLFSILFGFSLMALGERGHTLRFLYRRCGARRIRRDRDRHAGSADRRLRRDGLYHRQVRHRRDPQSRRPDCDVLCSPPRCS